MCDMEKLRFKNLRLNYEMMLQFGLPAVKPDFMKPRWGIPKQTADTFSDKESDEEWRPRPKRKRAPKPWRPPLRTPSATVTSASACSGFTAHQASTSGVRKTRKKTEKPKEEPRVYSFRKRKDVNYMKLEVPNDDEFIYCEECDQEFQGDCPEHGPFHVVDDTPVPSQKRADPQRALKTLPPGLEVRESGIPDAGLGVFATQFFPTRSRFGPYQGRHVTDPDIAHSSGYCWQICTDEGYSYFVDAKDCKTANWMRYVNCARTRAEQNVTAFQHCGEVYYRAHCDIQPGTEILVWYGREYGKELGIIREDDELKSKRRSSTVQPESDSERLTDDQMNFSDIRTSDIEFSDSSEEEDCNNRKRKTPKDPVPSRTRREPGVWTVQDVHTATPRLSSHHNLGHVMRQQKQHGIGGCCLLSLTCTQVMQARWLFSSHQHLSPD
ncbi:histone-lysine N-methyltransferase PRDM7-like [Babylonia areolata]|uniref:histone-lysine N-methyltransferase PRDM7-like n=1 Tax=Babylonia areolata TaxID=304850 RepID=UPI003FD1989C